LAELVAQHPKTAGRVAELGGGFVGEEPVDEVSPQRFILPMRGRSRLLKELGADSGFRSISRTHSQK
jgi:hypothetical protein